MDIRQCLQIYLQSRSKQSQLLRRSQFKPYDLRHRRTAVIGILIMLALFLSLNQIASPIIQASVPVEESIVVDLCTKLEGEIQAECKVLTGTGWWNYVIDDESSSHCDLPGIKCENNRVTEITIVGRELNSSIPPSLGTLSRLERLSLSNTKLSGHIPIELEELIDLKHLNLSYNRLSPDPEMLIPFFPSVTKLNLSSNNLSGDISMFLFGPQQFVELDLSSNEFTGNIPSGWVDFTPLLEMLDLSGNQLTGTIPADLGGLDYLKELNLSGNRLEDKIPGSLFYLADLLHLDLSKNQLRGISSVESNRLNISKRDGIWDLGMNAIPVPENSDLSQLLTTNDFDWSWTQTVAPTDFVAELDEVGYPRLEWEPIRFKSGTAGFYEVSYRTNIDDEYQVHGQTVNRGSTYYTIDDAEPHTTYYVRIRTFAFRSDDLYGQQNEIWSEYSEPITITTGSFKPMLTPTPIPARSLVMVYAVLDNDLGEYVSELKRKLRAGTEGKKDMVVWAMIDGPGSHNAKLYKYQDNHEISQDDWYIEDTAHYSSVAKFLSQSLEENPIAETIALSLVGHGGGWSANGLLASQPTGPKVQGDESDYLAGMLWDETTDKQDSPKSSISTVALAQVLHNSLKEQNKTIDLLYLDACSMGSVEVAYELTSETGQQHIDYLLAAPNTAWSTFPYDELLQAVESGLSGKDLGRRWLDIERDQLDTAKYRYPAVLTLVDMNAVHTLRDAIEDVASELSTMLPEYRDAIQSAFSREDLERFESNYDGQRDEQDTYVDIGSLADALKLSFISNHKIVGYSQDILAALEQTIPYHLDISGYHPYYLEEGRNKDDYYWSWERPSLSIYAPTYQDETRRVFYTATDLRWTNDGDSLSHWGKFIQEYWNLSEEALAADRTRPDDLCRPSKDTTCDVLERLSSASSLYKQPLLRIPESVPGREGEVVDVAIEFEHHDNQIDAMIFSLDYNESCLDYREVIWDDALKEYFEAKLDVTEEDTTGELNVRIFAKDQVDKFIEDKQLGKLRFLVQDDCNLSVENGMAHLKFVSDSPMAFESLQGIGLSGDMVDGFFRLEEPNRSTPLSSHDQNLYLPFVSH